MRVLHVIPSLSPRSGGPAQALPALGRSLTDQGVKILIAATDEEMPSLEKIRPTFFESLPAIFFPIQGGPSFKYSRPFARWLDEHVPEFDLVHIHAVFNHACIAAARACRRERVPYIVRPLGTLAPWSMSQKSLRKRLFWQISGRRMLLSADAVHYTSLPEQLTVEQSLGLSRGIVVPLGVDVPLPSAYSSLLYPIAQPYVLVMSRLDPKKALDVLIEAFLSVAEQKAFESWKLVLAGDGPATYVRKLKHITQRHRASDRIIFTGWLEGEKKWAAVSHASLLALVSYHENFGLCVMESLACGVPALVTRNVDLAIEIETSQSGWVCNLDEPSLQKTLTEALSSGAELRRRGLNGRQLAQNYSWPRVAKQLRALYSDILRNRESRAVTSEKIRAAAAL